MKPSAKVSKAVSVSLLAAALVFSSVIARAQGCAQCKDNVAATPPASQRAYRHAILLLSVAAGGLFGATILLFRRNH